MHIYIHMYCIWYIIYRYCVLALAVTMQNVRFWICDRNHSDASNRNFHRCNLRQRQWNCYKKFTVYLFSLLRMQIHYLHRNKLTTIDLSWNWYHLTLKRIHTFHTYNAVRVCFFSLVIEQDIIISFILYWRSEQHSLPNFNWTYQSKIKVRHKANSISVSFTSRHQLNFIYRCTIDGTCPLFGCLKNVIDENLIDFRLHFNSFSTCFHKLCTQTEEPLT